MQWLGVRFALTRGQEDRFRGGLRFERARVIGYSLLVRLSQLV